MIASVGPGACRSLNRLDAAIGPRRSRGASRPGGIIERPQPAPTRLREALA